jgi:hypothetical protein
VLSGTVTVAEADTGLVDEHEQAASEGKLPMTW